MMTLTPIKLRRALCGLVLVGCLTGADGLRAQVAQDVTVSKEQDFLQNSSATPTSHIILGAPGGSFNFVIEIDGSNLNLFAPVPKVTLPNATQYTLVDEYPGNESVFGLTRDFTTKSAMDAAFPIGTYTFTAGIYTGNNAMQVSLGTMEQYPAQIPAITNGTWDAQGNLVIDASADTTLNFNTYVDYANGVGGEITFTLYAVTVPANTLTYLGQTYSLTLNGIASQPAMTSYTIPANFLQSNQTYYAELAFIRIVSIGQGFGQAIGIPGFLNYTGFMITTGPVGTAPTVSILPLSQTVSAGTQVTFTATVGGTPTPTLQWKKNNADIGGATASTYSIASASAGDAGTYTVVATNSAGSTTSNAATLAVNTPASTTTGFTADFNGDGKADILWTNTSTGDRYVWLMNGGSVTASVFLGSIAPQWTAAAGDFNGDGKADILWSNTSSGDRYIWLMNGGSVAGSVFLGTIAPQWTATTGDFNGDGKADILWSNTSSGDRYIWLMNGGSVVGSIFLGTVAPQWMAATGDFNGDGKADLLWSNASSGDRYIWLMNGGSVAGSVFLGTVAPQWTATPGDLSGDGKADLVWSNTATGDRYVWLMNGGSVAGSVFLGTIAPQWTPTVGDLNGDGKVDLIWSNTSNGDRYIWLMNGGSVAGSIFLGTVAPQWAIGG